MEERKDEGGGAMGSVQNCLQSLEPIEDCIHQLVEVTSYDKIFEQLSPVEKAKLDVGMAYGLASLLFITLKAQVPICYEIYPDYLLLGCLHRQSSNQR